MSSGFVARLLGRQTGPKVGDRLWWADKAVPGVVTVSASVGAFGGRRSGAIRFVAGPPSAPRQFHAAANASDAKWDAGAMAWVLGSGAAPPPANWQGWSTINAGA